MPNASVAARDPAVDSIRDLAGLRSRCDPDGGQLRVWERSRLRRRGEHVRDLARPAKGSILTVAVSRRCRFMRRFRSAIHTDSTPASVLG